MPDEDVENQYFYFFSIFEFIVGFLKQTVGPWVLFQNHGSHSKTVGLGMSALIWHKFLVLFFLHIILYVLF